MNGFEFGGEALNPASSADAASFAIHEQNEARLSGGGPKRVGVQVSPSFVALSHKAEMPDDSHLLISADC